MGSGPQRPAPEPQPPAGSRRPRVWALPLNVTEASLPHGGLLARRIPDVLVRLLRAALPVDARFALMVDEVEEGLAYTVCVATADEIDAREYLQQLGGGDYLLFGQAQLVRREIWLDLRLYSAGHDEIILYPSFSGPETHFLAALAEIAAEVTVAVGGARRDASDARVHQQAAGAARGLLTADWEAFTACCEAVDALTPEEPDPDEEFRAMERVLMALEKDPGFGLALQVGLEIASGSLGRETIEHCLDVTEQLGRVCPQAPEVPAMRAAILRELGREDAARAEEERARELKRQKRGEW